MILVILKIIRFKRHQTDNGSLLRLGGNIIGIERLRGELGCLFGGCAFAFCGGIVAGLGRRCDGDHLGFRQGVPGDEGEGEGYRGGGCYGEGEGKEEGYGCCAEHFDVGIVKVRGVDWMT